ncbi:CvpA family protein [Holdemania massiliensis]|uniref:CvpA family protein n=1 Tax=Holdemania massiliensis TaxID=1468449 RepID=UPI00356A4849
MTQFHFNFDPNSFQQFKTSRKPKMKPGKAHVTALIITLVLALVIDYVTLPAWNLHSPSTVMLVIFLLVIYGISDFILVGKWGLLQKLCAFAAGFLFVAMLILMFLGSELLNAEKYRDQIAIKDVSDFSSQFQAISMERIPVVDQQTAALLGDKQIGKQAGLGSQYQIDQTYTLISSDQHLYRVSPLEYRDFIKWFQNNGSGIPGFIQVNVTDPNDVDMVMLEKGIKYSPSAWFNQNLFRHIRFRYRTELLSDYSFELDDDGYPYWVVSVVAPEIGYYGGLSAQGVIIVDPITGEMNKYNMDEIPAWVDRVQPAELAWNQIDNWGYYVHGFFNTLFGQKDMIQTTDGYNFVNIDGQTYVFSGLTSVAADHSINGFALINLRTKEASYIKVGGADEVSAMASAEGQVQHLNYRATFPILLNVANEPTYFISLKDSEGLVKMYSFVDVNDYSIVGIGETMQTAHDDYLRKLKNANKQISADVAENKTVTGIVMTMASAVQEGTTHYYITLENDPHLYVLSLDISAELPLTQPGQRVSIEYLDTVGSTVAGSHFDNLEMDYE